MALIVAPKTVLRAVGGDDHGSRSHQVMRLLGGRHLIEAAAEWRFGPTGRRIGTGVDVAHALTGVGFGYADRRWRRAAFTDAAVATGFAVLGVTNP